jgi:hypothetical protein
MSPKRIIILFYALSSLAMTVLGQTSGAVSGAVRDSIGEAIAGATISIISPDTGVTRQVATSTHGSYRVEGLAPGRYQMTVEHPGFSSDRRIINVTVAEVFSADVTLRPADLVEDMTVKANLGGVEVSDASQSGFADEKKVEDLPLNGRDLAQVILLQPGVVNSRASAQNSDTGRGTKFSSAGARPSQNNFQLDGTTINDPLNNTPGSAQGLLIGVETIKEFRVLTSTYTAENGRASGGQFVAVTKSGSNDFHGSAFEFLRNNALNARNFFDQQKPAFRRDQFGGSIGGPIIRKKTFFFGSYEGFRERKGIPAPATVPDDNARQGMLPGRVFLGVDPRAAAILSLYPRATGNEIIDSVTGQPTGWAEYFAVIQRPSRDDFFNLRVDHNWSDTQSVFVRYTFDDSDQLAPRYLPQYSNEAINRKQIATINWKSILSSKAVNEARFGFNRSTPSELVLTPETDVSIIVGHPVGEISVAGTTPVGTDRTNPKLYYQNNFQLSDAVSLSRGKHGIKVGAMFERFQFNGDVESRTRGRLRFSTLEDLLSFRAKDLESATFPSDFARGFRQNLFAGFVQDDFRVLHRLTLNLGVRYEYVTSPSEVNGKIANLRAINDPAVTVGGDLFQPPKNDIAPRFGFGLDPFGDGKTAIRGGFGLYYEQPLFNIYRQAGFGSIPFSNQSKLIGNQITTLPIPLDALRSGLGMTDAIQYDVRPTYLEQYSFNIQRQVFDGIVTSVAYIGSRGVNLFGQTDINTAYSIILPGGRSFFPSDDRRNPNFTQVRGFIQGFGSVYNALNLGLVKQSSKGLQFQVSYTYGKSLDERSGSSGKEYLNGQERAVDPYNRSLDRARSDFDVRHTFTANLTYDVPVKSKRFRGLLKEWQISAIVKLASGVPFTPLVDGDPDGDGTDDNAARPNLVPGVSLTPPGGSTPNLWFNPLAFAPPTIGFRGTAGRNILNGPNFRTVDTSLKRKFRITEKSSLQLRVEAFNLFNRANFNLPVNSDEGTQVFTYLPASGSQPASFMRTPNAGRIFETVSGPREIQLGLKFTF